MNPKNVEVFDERRCSLGEGPSSRGHSNSMITWVDILGKKVLWRDLQSGDIGSFDTEASVGFAVPQAGGGYVLGSGSSLLSRSISGETFSHFECVVTPDVPADTSVRWNDAKVSPDGYLFAGSMADSGIPNAGRLYRLTNQYAATELLAPVSVSNGLDWSVRGDQFFYIDTLSYELAIFDYHSGEISNRRGIVKFDPEQGVADGMCSDSEDGLWVAFFGGSRVVRYTTDGDISEVINMPVRNPTSCAFAGENLDQLIITTAELTDEDSQISGMTFITNPGVTGKATKEF